MDVFFIRHGETEYNKKHVHQPIDAPLNERGRREAVIVGEAIQKINPTHLVTSPFRRAKETAGIINDTLNLSLTESEHFIEILRPEKVRGIHYFAPRSIWYMFKWFLTLDQKKWNIHDAESHLAFLARIQRAREYLETFPEDARVVVVSHSVFTHFFVEHVCNEKPMSLIKAMLLVLKLKRLDNGSITHITCAKPTEANICRWSTVRFDDDTHLRQL